MMEEKNGSRGEEVRPAQSGHEKYRELCALAASGNLNQAEQEELREHLADCAECREAVKEFRAVVDDVILRAAVEVVGESPFDNEFSQEDASASFRKRVAEEKERERIGALEDEWLSPMVVRRSRNFRRHFTRYHLWIPIAVSTLLAVALGILAYRTGMSRGLETARLEEPNGPRMRAETPAAVHVSSAPNYEGPSARETALAELRRQIAQKSGEVEKLKAEQTKQQADLQAASVEEQERWKQLTEERDRLLLRVSGEDEALREAQAQFKKLESDRSESVAHTATLEKKNYELAASLADAQRLTGEQQQLLARDRDIRELMGARDLHNVAAHCSRHVRADRRKAELHPQDLLANS
jgi:DNA repair exonuclease SbcCD ATPase subunit